MARRSLTSNSGFTYIAVLVMILIMGIMQTVVAQTWVMIMKREREEELLFRGKQIVDAIGRWQNPKGTTPPPRPRPLNDLKDLLKDPGSTGKIRYLRKDPATAYNDPITGKDWDVLRDQTGKGIVGVRSTSEAEPLKQENFLELYSLDPVKDKDLITMYKNMEGKKSYKEWQFVYGPPVTVTNVTTMPGRLPSTGPPQLPGS